MDDGEIVGAELDRWTGTVVSVGEDVFEADIVSSFAPVQGPHAFPLKLVKPEELHLVKPGAQFAWVWWVGSSFHMNSRLEFKIPEQRDAE